MLNILIKEKYTIGSIRLDECNGKLMECLQTMKACGEMLSYLPN